MDFLQPKKFRYTLNIRGVETIVWTKTTESPNGWMDTSIKYEKSKTYGGIFRSLTLPLNFVAEAKELLSTEMTKYGILARVTVTIDQSQPDWSYKTIFNGVLDFSKAVETISEFQIPAISNDFSVQLAAYDGVKYDIPVNVPEAIDIECTPLILSEQAQLLPEQPTDGNVHADYFPEMQLVNYTARSIVSSTRAVAYGQLASPDFSTVVNYFFVAQTDTIVNISGQLNYTVLALLSVSRLKLSFRDQTGADRYIIYDDTPAPVTGIVYTANLAANIAVNKGDRLFLYISAISEHAGLGITINADNSNILLKYTTTSISTFTKGLRLSYVFDQLLKKMNTNIAGQLVGDVVWQSSLLNTTYQPIAMTCSNAIRTKDGEAIQAGGFVAPDLVYRVTGTVTYNSVVYTDGQFISSVSGVTVFTGTGTIAQTGISVNVGNTYNAGDTIPAGGKFLVLGNSINYNGSVLAVNTFFNLILGVDSFTATDPDNPGFVQEVQEAPSIQISFQDFFKTIYSISGGDCQLSINNGVVILENLGYIYQPMQSLALGNTDKTTKREIAFDKLYNTIKVGQITQQYDVLNGTKETNAEQRYFTVMQFVNNPLDLRSPSRMDCTGIEQVRVTAGDTAASRSDNDTYLIWLGSMIAGQRYYQPLGQDGITITGVDPGFYNWMLSPKRNLLRGSSYLASIYYHMKGYQIMFAGADKNATMVVTSGGVRIAEGENVNIDDLGAPYFIPFYWTVTSAVKNTTLGFLDSAPFGYLSFNWNGYPVNAYPESVTIDVGKNSAQAFKLLQSI